MSLNFALNAKLLNGIGKTIKVNNSNYYKEREKLRDSFIFYRSFFEAIKDLDNNIRLDVYDAICCLALNQEATEMQPMSKALFVLIKPILDANNARFLNGKKGGNHNQKETKDQPRSNQKATKKQPNKDKDKEVDVDKDKDKEDSTYSAKTKVFTPPLSEEVINYFIEQGSDREHGEQFYDHFTSNGWLVGGKAKMKDWRASARNWIRNIPNFLPKEQREEEARKKFIASL